MLLLQAPAIGSQRVLFSLSLSFSTTRTNFSRFNISLFVGVGEGFLHLRRSRCDFLSFCNGGMIVLIREHFWRKYHKGPFSHWDHFRSCLNHVSPTNQPSISTFFYYFAFDVLCSYCCCCCCCCCFTRLFLFNDQVAKIAHTKCLRMNEKRPETKVYTSQSL